MKTCFSCRGTVAMITLGVTLMLSACGGGGSGSTPEASPASTTPAPTAPASSASTPSSPSPSPSTPPPAPTVTIDMPVIYTPSQNMQLVFLQQGQERKIRYEDGMQVVSVVSGTPFEVLIPGQIENHLFTSIETTSNYIPGTDIYIGGNVMARGYPWEENADIGWDLNLGFWGRSFNAWYDNELPTTSNGYKLLKIKSVNHGQPLPADIYLLVYSPKGAWNSTTPGGNEYEYLKLRMLPAEPVPAASAR